MRIVVLGASGLVGSHVLAEAVAKGHDVIGTYRNYNVPGLIQLDLADEKATRELLEGYRPDWVVHSAGWTWVDGCEKDPQRAYRENCEQPAMVARLCRELCCRFAYFSTTYVFDGTAGPYSEEDAPNPINVYAQSKWEAEQAIQAIMGGNALIPRVICVWGKEAQQKNFVYQVIKAINAGSVLRIPSDQEGNPTWAGDIAKWLMHLMNEGSTGVWNLVGGNHSYTRVDWLMDIRRGLMAASLVSEERVVDWSYNVLPTVGIGQSARRPLRAGGVDSKIAALKKLLPEKKSSDLDVLRD